MDRYEEALERARAGKPLDEVFPELKESEDEKIRKWLYDVVDNGDFLAERPCETEKILAYLEKQKEQKPNIELIQKSWYLEGYHDGKYNIEPKWLIQTGKGGPRYEENPRYGTQKPAEWSEEDEEMIARICANLEYIIKEAGCDSKLKEKLEERIKWMKRLKSRLPQLSWKPSEEQMEALMWQVKNTSEGSWQRRASEELYNDLQKLL